MFLRELLLNEAGDDDGGSAASASDAGGDATSNESGSMLEGLGEGDDSEAKSTEGEGDSKEWFILEGQAGEGDRPEYLAPKYNSIEDQAKAYTELEKRLGAHTGAPEEYALSIPEALAKDSEGNELSVDDFYNLEDPYLKGFMSKAKECGLSQEAFTAIHHMYIEAEHQGIEEDRAEAMKLLGDTGNERLSRIAKWGKANLTEDDYQLMFNLVQQDSRGAETALLIESLISKAMPGRIATDTDPITPRITEAQLKEMQFKVDEQTGQRLMNVDPTYRKKVEEAYKEVYGEGDYQEIVN